MSSFAVPPLPEPISPELALVSPELAEIARAALPDRPWEAFLQPAEEALRLRAPVIAQAPAAPVEATLVSVAPRRARRHRPRVPVGMLLLTAFVGLVVAGSVLPVRDAPTLGPPQARANGLSTQQPAHTTPQGAHVATVPAPSTIHDEPPPRSTITSPTATRAAHANLAARRPQARPRGGYVLARGVGLLQVGADARSFTAIRIDLGCGWQIVSTRIRIAPDGRFSARLIAHGPGRPMVTVRGVFARGRTVHGAIRARKGLCAAKPVAFSGRLS